MYTFHENKLDWLWQLADGRYYSTQTNDFADQAFADDWLLRSGMSSVPASPKDEAGESSQQGLYEALLFYGLPSFAAASTEEQYNAERATVEAKYSAPWDGKTGGVVTLLQMTLTAATATGQDVTTLNTQYAAELANMNAEFEAIDVKYGVE